MKEQTIDNYNKKIAYAKNCNPKFKVKESNMRWAIGLDWHASSCLYCKKYMDYDGNCDDCPLFNKKKARNNDSYYFGCCNGLWIKMSASKTWGTWVKNAKKLLEYIKENG